MFFADLWQEYFRVEPLRINTANEIAGPTLGGIPIIVYVYILLGFGAIALALHGLYVRGDFSWQRLGRDMIRLIFIAWFVLDARALLNYGQYAWQDFRLFAGKSLAEQHALIAPPGVGQFARFLRAEVPSGRSVAIFYQRPELSIVYNLEYLLHPVIIKDMSTADFVAGFQMSCRGLTLFSSNEEGWIIKR